LNLFILTFIFQIFIGESKIETKMIASENRKQLLILVFAVLSIIPYSEQIIIKPGIGPIDGIPPSSWSGNCYAVRRYSCIATCVARGCYHAHCKRRFPFGDCNCQLCNRITLDVSELNCNTSRESCDQKCGEIHSGARGKCYRFVDIDYCNCWIH